MIQAQPLHRRGPALRRLRQLLGRPVAAARCRLPAAARLGPPAPRASSSPPARRERSQGLERRRPPRGHPAHARAAKPAAQAGGSGKEEAVHMRSPYTRQPLRCAKARRQRGPANARRAVVSPWSHAVAGKSPAAAQWREAPLLGPRRQAWVPRLALVRGMRRRRSNRPARCARAALTQW